MPGRAVLFWHGLPSAGGTEWLLGSGKPLVADGEKPRMKALRIALVQMVCEKAFGCRHPR
jgi:hypothetical protein